MENTKDDNVRNGAKYENGGKQFRIVKDLDSSKELYDEIMNCNNKENEYIRESIDTLYNAFRLYGNENVCVAFNGGKDATVVLYLTIAIIWKLKQFKKIHCIYLDDSNNFEQVNEFVNTIINDTNQIIHFESFQMNILEGIENFIQHKDDQPCCFVMGTRRSDPHGSRMEKFEPSSFDWPAFMRVNPIINWNYHQVWNFLLSFNLPFCHLYAQGYTSVGSIHNTLPNPALKNDDDQQSYQPAWLLKEESLERAGRIKRSKPPS